MNRECNTRKLAEAIGAIVLVSFSGSSGSVGVYCEVIDVRRSYGRIDLLVAPESGTGKVWVSMERVERTHNEYVCVFAPVALIGGAA